MPASPNRSTIITVACTAGLLILNYIVLLLGPISALHDELQYTRASIDRVETKVDEVRGYLKLIADDTTEDIPPASIK